ncbi:LacI family DNA-binding transcriptional regulator [Pseudactinotalea sp. Z1748]|uniref:LacI family DNA-binding transcriptional regulator n=1 Tax=Pseudactinotalea sp. Z1748 TaxID=3413027 RepID=UPI003C7B1598
MPEPMAARGRVTILDVAAAAGVSRQTVTRAMNDMAEIAPATRERVLQVARELRYRPSRFGRDLVSGRRRTIALVVHSLINPYYPELASAVVGAAARCGWNVVLADSRHASSPKQLLADLGEQADVVVGYLGAIPPDHRGDLLPLVVIDGDAGSGHAVVRFDAAAAMADLAGHLAGAGVRHPVMAVPGSGNARAREFAAAMARHQVPVRVLTYPEHGAGADGDPTRSGGEDLDGGISVAAALVREIQSGAAATDAVLGFNDLTACGLLKGFRRAGVAVPDQVRVAGIDGLSLGTVVSPELTTLALDLDEVAEHAVDLAIEIFDGRTGPGETEGTARQVSHRLLVRESA